MLLPDLQSLVKPTSSATVAILAAGRMVMWASKLDEFLLSTEGVVDGRNLFKCTVCIEAKFVIIG